MNDIADERVRERLAAWVVAWRLLNGMDHERIHEAWVQNADEPAVLLLSDVESLLTTPSAPGDGRARLGGPPWPSGCQSGAGDGLVMDDAPLVCAYCDEVCQLRPPSPATGQKEAS